MLNEYAQIAHQKFLAREREKLRADKRLRDAAPDLLDVVCNIGGIDDGWLKGAHPELLRKAIRDIRDEARAAIAKAEGTS